MVTRGDFCLRRQVLELLHEFLADVVQPQQIFPGVLQAQLGFAAARDTDTPAASSRKTRSSSGLASITREIIPCSMIA